MVEDEKKQDLDQKSAMRMDLEGRRASKLPIRLVEPRPFPKDERQRSYAMAADRDAEGSRSTQPFVLEEPTPVDKT